MAEDRYALIIVNPELEKATWYLTYHGEEGCEQAHAKAEELRTECNYIVIVVGLP